MIVCCACQCGSSDNLIRNFLQSAGYQDWLNIPIAKGKAASRSLLGTIPQYPEVEMLDHFLEGASKWAVVLGYNEKGCRWADISHNAGVSRLNGKMIVETFA